MLTSSRPVKLRKKHTPWFTYAGVIAGAIPVGFLLSLAVHSFWVFPVTIETTHMEPDFPKGTKIFFTHHFTTENLKKGSLVLSRHPLNPDYQVFLKIAAIGGDKVKFTEGIMFINDFPVNNSAASAANTAPIPGEVSYDQNTSEITLKKDEYFLVAINLTNGTDSRHFGPVKREHIIAVTD
jgi:signal peptidase I